MNDDTDHPTGGEASAPALGAQPEEIFSAALAALARPPKVGDPIEHDGAVRTITGTRIRGAGDFSVLLDDGTALRSR